MPLARPLRPSRRLPALAAGLVAVLPAGLGAGAMTLATPEQARAADAVPGQVLVAYQPRGIQRLSAHAEPRMPKVLHVRDVAATLRRLRERHDVRYAVRNVVAHTSSADPFVPDDPGGGTTAGAWQQDQWNFTGPASVQAPAAWGNLIAAGRPGGQGVTVAVLDTGIAYRRFGHLRPSPDLAGTKFVRGYDFVGRDPYANDRNGHGTHVASTIAEATNNGIGLTGLAYGASIMPVKVLDDQGEGDALEIAKGVRFAARHGAKVINLSLEFSADVRSGDIPQLMDAIAYAHRRGALVVAASGNEAAAAIAYPARADSVVSVGATTEHGCLADFSNQGHGLDLVAPGGGLDAYVNDPGCTPDGPAGRNIFQLTLVGPTRTRFGIAKDYEGTSMAVPHVSATAALVIASGVLGPNPSPSAVERRMEMTARDLGPAGYDTRYGYGLVDAGAATDPSIPVG